MMIFSEENHIDPIIVFVSEKWYLKEGTEVVMGLPN